MPPTFSRSVTDPHACEELLTLWLTVLACKGDPTLDPGRVVAHRLNRAEYDNTVRDLFGTALRPARDFPADDFGVGFDNIAEVLSISPLHVELYDHAANALVDELFGTGLVPPVTTTFEAESGDVRADLGSVWDVTGWVLWTEGAVQSTVWITDAGDYTVGVDAFGQQAGDEVVRMAVRVDGAEVAVFDVPAVDAPAHHEVRLALPAGSHTIAAAFTNEYKQPPADRNLIVDRLQITGPLDVPRVPSPSRGRVLTCDPAEIGEPECAEQIARTFGRRAFRRPLTEPEVAAKMRHYGVVREAGGSWEEGVRALLQGLLLSPYFVYRVEPDPWTGPRALNGYELAARLSYFVWSSTPDDRLLDLAQSGALDDPGVLAAEARRLLDDPRSEALVDNLAGQWLGVRKVDEARPSAAVFPEWDSGLHASMRTEIAAFVGNVLRSNRSALELFTTDETFVDARLARHYGIPEPEGEGFAAVRIPERPGLLARAGLLSALAYPTRTSPVIRGSWILGNMLCAQPPPPPAGVLPFEDAPSEPVSMREQLAQHRENPACASCHDQMDGLGLALEGYDAIGRSRTVDDYGFPVDTTGELPNVGSFDGAAEMQRTLVSDPRLPACMVKKVFTYALGRAPTATDDPALAQLGTQFAASGYRFEDLVLDVVGSQAFRWRSGEAP